LRLLDCLLAVAVLVVMGVPLNMGLPIQRLESVWVWGAWEASVSMFRSSGALMLVVVVLLVVLLVAVLVV
jgi:hypothetical protein